MSHPHRRSVAAAAMIVLSSLAFASCAAQAPAPTSSDAAGASTLVVANRNEVTTLDPSQTSYLQVDSAVAPLYDTLTTYNADRELVGSLASDFVFNDDATALTITLRDDVTFHDGAPLTAEDVKYTLDRIITIGTGVVGQLAGYAGSTVVDDHTVEIQLKASDALFAAKLSRIYIVNSALVRENEGSDNAQSWLLSNDAGSGPYILVSNDSGTITYARYDEYFDFAPDRAATLVLRRIDELAANRDELIAGTIDAAAVASADVETIENAGLSVAAAGSSEAIVWFNNSVGATSDPAVRKAIRLAYDYQGGLDSIRGGAGELNSTVLPMGLACAADLPSVHQDLDEAKQVLADAGLSGLTITMRYQPAFEEQVQEATLLQSNLAEIGVTVNLEPIAFADYLTLLTDWSTVPELMLAGEGLPVPEPGVMLSQVYDSAAVGTNKAAFADPAVDALIAKLKATPDADERCGIIQDIETTLDEADAAMPLYTVTTQFAHGSRVALGDKAPLLPSGQVDFADLRVAN